jgi:nucleoside-diphosphate-sugar epimerase
MTSILVTGAAGFVGRHCLEAIANRDLEVHAVTSRTSSNDSYRGTVRWHHADIFDGAAVHRLCAELKPSHLLHLAWCAEPEHFWTSADNYRWVEASIGLFRSFLAAGGSRAVVAGSCAEYDWRYGWCSEQATPLAPCTPYGVSKDALRRLAQSICVSADASLVWARIFWLYGPHEHPNRLVSSVASALLRGERARCTYGSQVRDYLHAADAGRALVALLLSHISGPVNVCSGEPVSVRTIVELVADAAGRPDLLAMGSLPQPIGEAPFVVGDSRRLREGLGWTPEHRLRDGISATVAWWRTYLSGNTTPIVEGSPAEAK